jgi:hypothetical protein
MAGARNKTLFSSPRLLTKPIRIALSNVTNPRAPSHAVHRKDELCQVTVVVGPRTNAKPHSLNDSYGIIRGHSALMPAALMIGHHFSISTFCNVASACGVC